MASPTQPKIQFVSWKLILILFLLTIGIGGAGYFYYENQKARITQDKQNNLDAIAVLKVNQIVTWRTDRLGDAGVIASNPYIASWVEPLMKDRPPSGIREEALSWMASLRRYYQYKDIFLVDPKGSLRLSTVKGDAVFASYDREAVLEAIRKKEVVLLDLHRDESSSEIHIDLIAPLFTGKGSNLRPIGALMLRIDPYQFLYPLIQSWPPTHTPSSETLLIRRDGNDVVFLNELRHRKETALLYRFSITDPQLPAAMAVRGKEGVVRGFDYRGTPVLAAIRAIPDSPWFLVAKMDVEEIEAPLRERAGLVQILVIVLIAAAGISIGFFRARRIAKLELERQALTLHYDYLSKYANDIILLLDEKLNILEANDRALTAYGYSLDELLAMNTRELRTPESRSLVEDLVKQVEEKGGIVFEVTHVRRDGTTFPVEVSTRFIKVDGKKFYQHIIRDITKRKQAEAELRRTASELARSNAELKEFAYVASHDLKDPLLAIGSYLLLLSRHSKGKLDATADEYIDRSLEGVTRMQNLINDLLAYSRVGVQGKPFEPVDGETVLGQALANLDAMIKQSGAVVTHDPLPAVTGDLSQLAQVFQNLIGNAIKFHRTETAPSVHISATLISAASSNPETKESTIFTKSDVPKEWVFSVKDNRIKIEPQHIDQVFVIFQRLHSQKEYPGTRIGLAICKKIVEHHGGRIWAESQPGEGSTFYFTIPAFASEN